ncbi:MAG TPA: 4Fe-4S dicluster domain-containing protein [Spirochaetes bacterium]|nr:4Fe-4S dicluster domain-containing protein [Spirochaetota bacterium]
MNRSNTEDEKVYWQDLRELEGDQEFIRSFDNEFPEESTLERLLSEEKTGGSTSRRGFLKAMGFGIGTVSLAACSKAPVRKAIPYLFKPEELTPGVANWYASTCSSCTASCSILVKTREGRPIKIEGNPQSKLTSGGVCAQGQASVLDLYDSERLYLKGDSKNSKLKAYEKGPQISGGDTQWKEIDKLIKGKLSTGTVAIVSSTILSPATKKLIDEFKAKYTNVKHVTYDAVSYSAIIEAHGKNFGKAVLPNYQIDKAKVIVNFGADFLGTWIAPVRFIRQYTSRRNVQHLESQRSQSRHIQFESILSLTGSNADLRIPVKPSEEGIAILSLYNELAKNLNKAILNNVPPLPDRIQKEVVKAAKELAKSKGQSLVLSGSNDLSIQMVVNAINSMIGSYGNTIDLDNYSNQKQGSDRDMQSLVEEIKSDKIKGIIFYNANPVYDYPDFPTDKLKAMDLTVSLSNRKDETTSAVKYFCPDHHSLESWNDAEPRKGYFTMTQPTIEPIFNTRAAQDSLMVWMDKETSYYNYLQKLYKKGNQDFWDNIIRDGVFEQGTETVKTYPFQGNLEESKSSILSRRKTLKGSFELVTYQSVGMRDGKHGNNPWLQELPDPIARTTWDNFVSISSKNMKDLKLKQGDIVKLTVGKVSIELPALPQPGQADGTIGVALGYGHTKIGKVGDTVGQNVFPFTKVVNGAMSYSHYTAQISPTGERDDFALTQTYNSIRDPFVKRDGKAVSRNIVKETVLEDYLKDPKSGNTEKIPHYVSLWNDRAEREYSEHDWGMVIDLNSCVGCGACVISCQAENNVAVVGKSEVHRRREMHWIRVSRYYSESPDNPEVIFQPMMCQHCDHAPCESVCPVAATTHSIDGLNQQAYNRCVGTRYCANNCPYKVRRFNWFEYPNNDDFDYNMNNPVGKMVLNPDVVVRSRGVMEKCSMCIQRIQAGRLVAKKEGRPLKDGEDIKMACEQSCPAQAIVFGDRKNPESKLHKLYFNDSYAKKYKKEKQKHNLSVKDYKENRQPNIFLVLEEVKALPTVSYLTKVRNKTNEEHNKVN